MHIIILSRKPENIVPCVESIFKNEPELSHKNIVIMDDGAGTPETKSALPDVTWIDGVKPFIFSRNVNTGIQHSDDDCIVLNDDTTLETLNGFSKMAEAGATYGITSACISGLRCGYGDQRQREGESIRSSPGGKVAFIAVLIPKKTYSTVGPLDERFVKYGYDDDDYCGRAQKLGLWVMIYNDCVVRHYEDRMTFHGPESTNNITHWYDGDNQAIYKDKWGLK